MFRKIMVPVDLSHVPSLQKALACAADLAGHFGASVTYVGVTSSAPGPQAHNPEEYDQKLGAFAAEQGRAGGVQTAHHAIVSHDPTSDLDDALLRATEETGADLVVMASHEPGVMDYFWPSHGGRLAEHAKCSVLVVRG